ncbi:hypothetical protein [Pseudomonas sp. TWR1-1-4]|uniref:hypothetical protein n=1 Tax=Pseudomonas sp. TWR1-1-4 TaxID=2804604 RepID=UPI003CED2071
MMTLLQLHHYIEQCYLFGDDRDVHCCKNIASAVLHDSRVFYTYGDLLVSAGANSGVAYEISDVQYAINVLKGSQVRLLREVYRYIDEDVIYDLSTEELQVAMQDGALNLELRGYPDRDFKSKVYVIFSADRTVVVHESNY